MKLEEKEGEEKEGDLYVRSLTTQSNVIRIRTFVQVLDIMLRHCFQITFI